MGVRTMFKRKDPICPVCQNPFPRNSTNRISRGSKERPRNSITCSTKCSKDYNRIARVVKARMKAKKKTAKNEKEKKHG